MYSGKSIFLKIENKKPVNQTGPLGSKAHKFGKELNMKPNNKPQGGKENYLKHILVIAAVCIMTANIGYAGHRHVIWDFPRIVIKIAPPTPVIEIRPVKPCVKAVWIDGHWKFRLGRYVWIKGYWNTKPKGKHWIPGHWKKGRRGYIWISGHWN